MEIKQVQLLEYFVVLQLDIENELIRHYPQSESMKIRWWTTQVCDIFDKNGMTSKGKLSGRSISQ